MEIHGATIKENRQSEKMVGKNYPNCFFISLVVQIETNHIQTLHVDSIFKLCFVNL